MGWPVGVQAVSGAVRAVGAARQHYTGVLKSLGCSASPPAPAPAASDLQFSPCSLERSGSSPDSNHRLYSGTGHCCVPGVCTDCTCWLAAASAAASPGVVVASVRLLPSWKSAVCFLCPLLFLMLLLLKLSVSHLGSRLRAVLPFSLALLGVYPC